MQLLSSRKWQLFSDNVACISENRKMHYGDPANGDFTAGMRKGVLGCLSFLNRLYGYKHLPRTMHVDGYGLGVLAYV